MAIQGLTPKSILAPVTLYNCNNNNNDNKPNLHRTSETKFRKRRLDFQLNRQQCVKVKATEGVRCKTENEEK